MGSLAFLIVLSAVSMSLISPSQGYDFYVGGKDGWVLNPPETFNHWAERNRFLINDSLVFRYKKEEDSVLMVKKEDYDNCNTNNPISSFNDGYTVFKFDRSGPFHFISGTPGNCEKGQKLVVIVLTMKRPPSPVSLPPPFISPSQSPTSPSPSAPTQAPTSQPPSTPRPGSTGAVTAPVLPPPRPSSSPALISFNSAFSLGAVMAVVFGSFLGLL